MVRRKTSAITHVPMAKYPPSSRNATSETGTAINTAIAPATGTATKGDKPP